MKRFLSILLSVVMMCLFIPNTQVQAYEIVLSVHDGFDQGIVSYRDMFSDLKWTMDIDSHLTYHDMLKKDYLNTLGKLLTIFDIGKINQYSEQGKQIRKEIGLDNGDGSINIYKKDEINDTFNMYFGTDIDLMELPNIKDYDYWKVQIYGDYFIFFLPNNGYLNYDADTKSSRYAYLNDDTYYWEWGFADENWTIVSHDIYHSSRYKLSWL